MILRREEKSSTRVYGLCVKRSFPATVFNHITAHRRKPVPRGSPTTSNTGQKYQSDNIGLERVGTRLDQLKLLAGTAGLNSRQLAGPVSGTAVVCTGCSTKFYTV